MSTSSTETKATRSCRSTSAPSAPTTRCTEETGLLQVVLCFCPGSSTRNKNTYQWSVQFQKTTEKWILNSSLDHFWGRTSPTSYSRSSTKGRRRRWSSSWTQPPSTEHMSWQGNWTCPVSKKQEECTPSPADQIPTESKMSGPRWRSSTRRWSTTTKREERPSTTSASWAPSWPTSTPSTARSAPREAGRSFWQPSLLITKSLFRVTQIESISD